MKTIFTIIAFFTLSFAFSQNGELTGNITEDGQFGFPGLAVELIKDGNSVDKVRTDFDGKYSFKNVPIGIYSIRVSDSGLREETVENVTVEAKVKILNFTYPKLCVSTKKICPKGHRNNIIPIAYGLPSKKMIKKAENKKVKLGGCTPYCEKWHCIKHNLDF